MSREESSKSGEISSETESEIRKRTESSITNRSQLESNKLDENSSEAETEYSTRKTSQVESSESGEYASENSIKKTSPQESSKSGENSSKTETENSIRKARRAESSKSGEKSSETETENSNKKTSPLESSKLGENLSETETENSISKTSHVESSKSEENSSERETENGIRKASHAESSKSGEKSSETETENGIKKTSPPESSKSGEKSAESETENSTRKTSHAESSKSGEKSSETETENGTRKTSPVESSKSRKKSSERETENGIGKASLDDDKDDFKLDKGLEDTSGITSTYSDSDPNNDSVYDIPKLSLCASTTELLASENYTKQLETDSFKEENIPCSDCEHPEPKKYLSKFNCFGWWKRKGNEDKVTEYWLISVPKEDDTWKRLSVATSEVKLSQNYKFHIPILKVGTQDILISLLEQLKTLDSYVKDVTVMLCRYIKEKITEQYGELSEDHIEEHLKVKNIPPVTYLTRFTWNKEKYPTWHSLPLLADRIFSDVDKINTKFKEKLDVIKDLTSKLKKYEGRHTENLRKRYLDDIVKKEHFVLGSNVFTTVLVVVPNKKERLWLSTYSNLGDMVVPNSSTKIFDDGSDSLYNVTIIKKLVDDFKSQAILKDFTVLNYEYSETEQTAKQDFYEHMSTVRDKQLALFFRWNKVMFGDCFETWIHVIALRVFVDSVLRFGLPINYQAAIIIPLKSRKKLKEILNKLFEDVDTALAVGSMHDVPAGLTTYAVQEYYRYVFFKLDLRFLIR